MWPFSKMPALKISFIKNPQRLEKIEETQGADTSDNFCPIDPSTTVTKQICTAAMHFKGACSHKNLNPQVKMLQNSVFCTVTCVCTASQNGRVKGSGGSLDWGAPSHSCHPPVLE